jgi:OmpA family
MKHLSLFICLVIAQWLNAQTTNFSYTVYFNTDQHQLSAEALKILSKALIDLSGAESYQIKIQSFTDDEGSNAYNQALGQRRADAVLAYFDSLGLATQNAKLNNYGEQKALTDNNTVENRPKNRRVDVYIQAVFNENFQSLLSKLNQTQTYSYRISSTKSTCLLTHQGTFLMIPAQAFVHANGNPVAEGEVTLQIQEYYQLSDMLMAGLSTSSNQKLLATGGMLNLKALAQGQELQLAPQKEIGVGMPIRKGQFDPAMELFLGNKDPHHQDHLNWNPTQRKATSLMAASGKDLSVDAVGQFAIFRKTAINQLVKQPVRPKLNTRTKRTIPQRPQRENIKVHLNFFQKIFINKQRVEAQKDRIYAKEVKNYQRSLKYFRRDSTSWKQYFQDSLNYVRLYQEALNGDIQNYQALLNEANYATANREQDQKKMQELYEKGVSSDCQLSQQTLDRYFFAVNRLGWINCDKFMNTPESQLTQIAIQDSDVSEERLMLVFPHLPSILLVKSKTVQGEYLSDNIPKGMPAKLIGIKVDQGRSMLAVKDIKVGESKQSYNLVYQPKSLREIQKVLESID